MDELKRGQTCMDCKAAGIEIAWPIECLQFDHRDPDLKVGSIRSLLWHPELLEAELAKCDIVCANHHAIRTRRRGVSEKTRAAIKAARSQPAAKEQASQLQKVLWGRNRAARAKAIADAQRTDSARQKNRTAQLALWKTPAIRSSRILGQKKAWARKSPEELSRKALKAWETRRRNET